MRSARSHGPPEAHPSPTPDAGSFAFRELRLRAAASELTHARAYLSAAAADFGLDDAGRYEFVFAANEAVTNAIRHGAPHEDGTIHLRLAADGDSLTLTVSDRGAFRPRAVDREPMADGGRGFTYMNKLVDEFRVSTRGGGTIVLLRKRRRGGSARRG